MNGLGTTAPLLIQIAQVLRRARKLPVGRARNDLRQLARALSKLNKSGLIAIVQIIEPEMKH